MRSFLYTGDWHLRGTNPRNRIDDYRAAVKAKLAEVFQLAIGHHVEAILIPGDVLDSPEISLGVLFDYLEVLRNVPVDIYTTIGNHDVYGYNLETYWRTSLRLLEMLVPRFHVMYKPTDTLIYGKEVQITFEPYSANMDINQYGYSPQGDAADFPGTKIHIAHGMLLDHTPPFDRYTLLDNVPTQADVILTGHDHVGYGIRKRLDGKIFCNPGALPRISASRTEMARKIQAALITVEPGRSTEIQLIPLSCAKPGEEVLDRSAIDAAEKRQYAMEQFSALVKTKTGQRILLNITDIVNQVAGLEKYGPEVVKVALETIEAEKEKVKA